MVGQAPPKIHYILRTPTMLARLSFFLAVIAVASATFPAVNSTLNCHWYNSTS
jgi:hypothetical protein